MWPSLKFPSVCMQMLQTGVYNIKKEGFYVNSDVMDLKSYWF